MANVCIARSVADLPAFPPAAVASKSTDNASAACTSVCDPARSCDSDLPVIILGHLLALADKYTASLATTVPSSSVVASSCKFPALTFSVRDATSCQSSGPDADRALITPHYPSTVANNLAASSAVNVPASAPAAFLGKFADLNLTIGDAALSSSNAIDADRPLFTP